MKMILKQILTMSILFSISSCSNFFPESENQIHGVYESQSPFGMTQLLEIHADSTFTFKWNENSLKINEKTSGEIVYANSTIKLFSRKPNYFSNQNLNNQKSIRLHINDEHETRIIGASCTSYKNQKEIEKVQSNLEGICELSSGTIDEILISHMNYQKVKIKLENESQNNWTINMNEYYYNITFDGNQIFIVDENTIKISTFDEETIFSKNTRHNNR